MIRAFEEAEKNNVYSRHKFISACGQYIYHLGIIDYLQAFDLSKQAENIFKVWFKQADGKLISACEPNLYAMRFYRFMRKEVIIKIGKTAAHERMTSFVDSLIF
jgi:hypothetical protein